MKRTKASKLTREQLIDCLAFIATHDKVLEMVGDIDTELIVKHNGNGTYYINSYLPAWTHGERVGIKTVRGLIETHLKYTSIFDNDIRDYFMK